VSGDARGPYLLTLTERAARFRLIRVTILRAKVRRQPRADVLSKGPQGGLRPTSLGARNTGSAETEISDPDAVMGDGGGPSIRLAASSHCGCYRPNPFQDNAYRRRAGERSCG
jgi:hypothetical protein